jgi:hypothetical protein
MKICRLSEEEIDQRLLLDSRETSLAFCRNFESELDLPHGFFGQQDRIRDGLEMEFFAKFDDGKDRSKLESWELATSHEQFFFPAEPINSERMIIELSSEILNDKLIGLILSYLEKFAPQYCVITAVCLGQNMEGKNILEGS